LGRDRIGVRHFFVSNEVASRIGPGPFDGYDLSTGGNMCEDNDFRLTVYTQ
jgi:hypothetical protein